MEIQKGYKQTDIGVIPEDWEVRRLIDVVDFSNNSINSDEIISSSYIGTENMLSEKKGVVPNEISILSSRVKEYKRDDILVSNIRPYLKKIWLADKDGGCSNDVLIFRVNNQTKYLPDFVFSLLADDNFFKHSMDSAIGTKMPRGDKNVIKEYLFKIPPTLAEQQAIAEVLSNIDALIEALDKKIAKKRAIKQGTMQLLLTGKKRLAGFTEPWVEKKFESILEKQIKKGQMLTSSEFIEGTIPVIAGGKTPAGYHSFANRDKNTITISASGAYAGFVSFHYNPICATDCSTINESDKFVIKFIYYLLCLNQETIYKAQTGGAQPHIHAKDIYPLEVSYTTDIEEQTAIARILTDMDDEIEQLEKERQKYTALKQGAMKKLLTGEIRLLKAPEQTQQLAEVKTIPVDAHIVGGHIVKRLHKSKGWGRTKLQKSIHLIDYNCQLDFGGEYIRNVAGPDNQQLMTFIDSKFKQFNHVRINVKKDDSGRKHINYTPTPLIAEVEQAFKQYPPETQKAIDDLLNKIEKMDLPRAEIVSTLYAVWNNRIIKKQSINDELLLQDFFAWSEHKSDFSKDLVLRGLHYMRQESIIPTGWGKYIYKK